MITTLIKVVARTYAGIAQNADWSRASRFRDQYARARVGP
jgi:hypothetical protein